MSPFNLRSFVGFEQSTSCPFVFFFILFLFLSFLIYLPYLNCNEWEKKCKKKPSLSGDMVWAPATISLISICFPIKIFKKVLKSNIFLHKKHGIRVWVQKEFILHGIWYFVDIKKCHLYHDDMIRKMLWQHWVPCGLIGQTKLGFFWTCN